MNAPTRLDRLTRRLPGASRTGRVTLQGRFECGDPALRPRRSMLVAALLGCGLAMPWLAGCGRSGAPSFHAIDITGANYARELSLPDFDGRVRTLADFQGQVVLVFFGFTHCPDVCPTTLVEVAMVKKALGVDGRRLQAVFVTIDPERDTPELLKAYVTNFDPGFIALRGTPEQTAAVAKHFKVYFAKVPGKTAGSYSMDHTAGAYLFDPQGRVRLFTRHGGGAQALEADVRQLLAGR